MTNDAVMHADRLLAQGRAQEAVAMIKGAAAGGDPGAMYQHAIWKLTGELTSRDLAGALTLLSGAAASGHRDAALMEVGLTGNGSGAPPNWQRALALLERAATNSPAAVVQLALLRRMSLNADGSPSEIPRPKAISDKPTVLHVTRLFMPEECEHVARNAADLLIPATVVDPRTGRNIENPVRTSDGAVIGPMRETLVVQALNRRIAAVTATDVSQGEALAVLRYREGQQFHPHLDSIENARNQRVKTVLIYLNDGFAGGGTFFPHSGVKVMPRSGDAIIFNNVRDDGSIALEALHAGEPVTRGVKWLATRWIRARPFSVWTGPEAA